MTNTNSSSNNTAINPITSAKFFRYNVLKNTIEGSELNFKKAGDPTSAQFAELMEFKALLPSFTLAPIAPKVKKQTYKGLNTDLIREYVEIKGSEAQKAELAEMIENEDVFATIKSWFLEDFKVGFSVEKAKREIAEHKLNARKAKVRTAVRVKTVKAAPAAVVEMPAAANF